MAKFRLSEGFLPDDPLEVFTLWLQEATATGMSDPDAMALATVSADGRPSVRMVLLKDFYDQCFVFFTNYKSRKGRELEEMPQAALLFFWRELGRQVRIEGRVRKAEDSVSDAYFNSRPLGSRAGAVVSPQSRVIDGKEGLIREWQAAMDKYAAVPPLRPAHWGGFCLYPEVFEFWEAGEYRLHDRFRYRRAGEGWIRERLAP